MNSHLYKTGWIELICGSMFSGKTEELIRRLVRAKIAKQKIQVFKPLLDDRYQADMVSSHSGGRFEAQVVKKPLDLLPLLDDNTNVIAIDEVQFFDKRIVDIAETLANSQRRVILAGLDMDFRGEAFGPIPLLMSKAEKVHKLRAICMVCGREASRTQRLINGHPAHYNDPIIMVGAKEVYEARCRQHHIVPGRIHQPITNGKQPSFLDNLTH
ncbi:thymidine kinase [Anaerolineales bacterium HSG24]|nr:thymidine kinase [Anaerolineales bacterium HSG24]